jgi:hypothetical protein
MALEGVDFVGVPAIDTLLTEFVGNGNLLGDGFVQIRSRQPAAGGFHDLEQWQDKLVLAYGLLFCGRHRTFSSIDVGYGAKAHASESTCARTNNARHELIDKYNKVRLGLRRTPARAREQKHQNKKASHLLDFERCES